MLTSDDRLQARPGLGAGQAGCALLVNWADPGQLLCCVMHCNVTLHSNILHANTKVAILCKISQEFLFIQKSELEHIYI